MHLSMDEVMISLLEPTTRGLISTILWKWAVILLTMSPVSMEFTGPTGSTETGPTEACVTIQKINFEIMFNTYLPLYL